MRRWAKRIGIGAGAAAGGVVLLVLVLLLGANTPPGRDAVAWLVPRVTSGTVRIQGLTGALPGALRVRRAVLADAAGPWLTARNVVLDWQPLQLLYGRIVVDRLTAPEARLLRLPFTQSTKKKNAKAAVSRSQPMPLLVRRLAIARLQIAPAIAGQPEDLTLTVFYQRGHAGRQSLTLDARSPAGRGNYRLAAALGPKHVSLRARIEEPAHGLLAGIAQQRGISVPGPIRLDAQLAGPRSDIATHLSAAAGPLAADASGSIDLAARAAHLAVSLTAPALTPEPGIAWQSVALHAKLDGSFARPTVSGNFTLADLAASGARVARITGKLAGSRGQARLAARFSGVLLPGPAPDLLAGAPLLLGATVTLDAPGRPVLFTLRHPLVAAQGRVTTAGQPHLTASVRLPHLAPLAAIAGLRLAGSGSVELSAAEQPAGVTIGAEAALALSGGSAPVFPLLGTAPHLSLAARLGHGTITLLRLALAGHAISLDAHGNMTREMTGGIPGETVVLAWRAGLPALDLIDAGVRGGLAAEGRIDGPADAFSLEADLAGTLGTATLAPQPFHAHLAATGLPRAPAGKITAQATLAGAPLDLAMAVARQTGGTIAVTLAKARWKSAHAEGAITLGPSVSASFGQIAFGIGHLGDFSSLAHQALLGSLTGSLESTKASGGPRLVLDVTGTGLRASGVAVARASLAAAVVHPFATPLLDATLRLAGLSAGGMSGAATLAATGTMKALTLRLRADSSAGVPASVNAAALIDGTAGSASLSALAAHWRSASVRLLAPARIVFSPGLSVAGLRLGMAGAEIDMNGRIRPSLALRVALRNATPALLAPFLPGLAARGTLDAEATLTGSLAAPGGSLTVHGSGLGLASGPAAEIPPASLELSAALGARAAQIHGALTAGSATRIAVSGTVPLAPAGAFDLAVNAHADLAALEPTFAAAGRRIAGRLALEARLRGTLAAPTILGSARLTGGMISDYTSGLVLTGIGAEATMAGGSLRIVRFAAHAGPGTVSLAGSVGVLEPGIPVSLTVIASNAELLQSDRITLWLDTNLRLDGSAGQRLAAAGTLHIRRAEIEIPKSLPPTVAVLHVVRAGSKPPPPPTPGPVIALDLTLDSPREVFVRGRGVDAEFGGRIHVTGTTEAPEVDGSFDLIRGQVSLAGQTLTFTSGTIGFNGGDPADPTLDLVATAGNSTTTATLTLDGTVEKPTVTLSSVPELPQDQVLATLFFGGGSSLSPIQLAEMAAALSSLSGVGPSVGDPFGTLRKGLGLDQLTIGSDASGNPAVQAGRYIGRRVYVGASQSTTGGGAEAQVKIDLTRRLKLEAATGMGGGATGSPTDVTGATTTNGSSVGLTYQFQY